jgi:hypothetical protein
VSDKIALFLALAALVLLVLWRQFGTSEEPPIGYGYSSGQINRANRICTELYGDETARKKQLADCNEDCGSSTGDAYRECLATCREKSHAFAECLLQYTTRP